MEKVVIWGTADAGKRIFEDIKNDVEVIDFVDQDATKELSHGYSKINRAGDFSNISEEIVMNKMVYSEQVEIRKGFSADNRRIGRYFLFCKFRC